MPNPVKIDMCNRCAAEFLTYHKKTTEQGEFMANIFQAPRGTADVLPEEIYKWTYVEKAIHDTAQLFGFSEIRFPTFENTELFRRGVGETTDVVQKEMFTFEHGKNSFTLRPEGTASTVRLVLANGLQNEPMPLKLFYITPCFRGERPQAGRLREFHQFGVELFGASDPGADVETIMLAYRTFENLGISGLRLEINSIGCPDCRKKYQDALREYFSSRKDELCDTCLSRLERNPMRILDCKSPECRMISDGAPKVTDYICNNCAVHFNEVKERLSALGIKFTVNTSIVRGLDYYTRTVFEFIDEKSGLTLCGGGRYDGLAEELGGPSIPALGFGMGIERLIMTMEERNCKFGNEQRKAVYFATLGKTASLKAAELALKLRCEGLDAEYDLMGRSMKAQMKYANRKGFAFTVAIGDNELQNNSAELKNMATGESVAVSLDEKMIDTIDREIAKITLKNLEETAENF